MPASKSQQKKQQLSNNNLIIVMVLITVLVVGVSALISKALFTSVVRDTKVIAAKSKADKQLKTDLDAAPKLVDAYNNLGGSANVLSDALPVSDDVPSLIVTLENMGNDAGVTVKSVSPSLASAATPGQSTASAGSTGTTTETVSSSSSSSSNSGAIKAASPQSYKFSINFEGSYAGLQKFLADVELSARPMKVTGMQINGTGGSMSGEIDMLTYWQAKAQLPFGTEQIK